MQTNKLVVSPAAQGDLKNIYQYGKNVWGVVRATEYIHHLKARFKYLIRHPQAGAVRDELISEIRCLPVKSHHVFYLYESQQVQIVRVLQRRQSAGLHIED